MNLGVSSHINYQFITGQNVFEYSTWVIKHVQIKITKINISKPITKAMSLKSLDWGKG